MDDPVSLIDNLVNELIEGKHLDAPSTISDPRYRQIFRDEMLVLQHVARKTRDDGHPISGQFLSGVVLGMETILRRLENQDKEKLNRKG